MSTLVFKPVSVSHVSVSIDVDFDQLTQTIERLAGHFDAAAARSASAADLRSTIELMQGEENLMIFGKQDHGALFALQGEPKKAFRYHIGNPLIAFSMTQHDIRAALYAPLTVLVYETGPNKTRVEFDLPSSLFGQFGVPEVTSVKQQLDEKLKRLIEKSAGLAYKSL